MASIPNHQTHTKNVSVDDRISNLPESLIRHILSFLPTKDVVVTSVLSAKWKYLWTFVTSLDFDDGLVYLTVTPEKSDKRRQSFINFVYRVLTQNVSDLQKFRLRCIEKYDVCHVDVWVSTALSRNIRELDLLRIKSVPSELFSCTSLEVLKLGGERRHKIDLNVPTLVCLPRLKRIVVESVKFLDDDSIYRLFFGCPVLEYLSMERCDLTNISVLNISAQNLKSLIIIYSWHDASSKYKVVLDTPNLQDLEYQEDVAEGYAMNNLNALVKADIRIRKLHGAPYSSTERYVVSDFLRGISNVQWLHLSSSSIGKTLNLCTFSNLTYLELGDNHEDVGWKSLLTLIASSPRLETLIFRGLAFCDKEYYQTTSTWYQPPSVPSCLSFHLKKIEINEFEGKSGELKMAEYFLLNSRMLEKLKIRAWYSKALEIRKKLLMLRKGNKTCQVEVL